MQEVIASHQIANLDFSDFEIQIGQHAPQDLSVEDVRRKFAFHLILIEESMSDGARQIARTTVSRKAGAGNSMQGLSW